MYPRYNFLNKVNSNQMCSSSVTSDKVQLILITENTRHCIIYNERKKNIFRENLKKNLIYN